MAIYDRMCVLASGHQANPRLPAPSFTDIFEAAVSIELGAKTQERARRQVAADVAKRNGQAIPRPTHRAANTAATGEQRAIERMDKFMRDHELTEDAEETIEF